MQSERNKLSFRIVLNLGSTTGVSRPPSMAINALDEIWQLGCPLSEAPWHFASVDLRKRYQLPKASRKLSPKSGLGMLGNVKDRPEAANLARIALRIQRLSDRSFARSEIIDQMRASVIDRLQRGKLVALGFRK